MLKKKKITFSFLPGLPSLFVSFVSLLSTSFLGSLILVWDQFLECPTWTDLKVLTVSGL